MKNKVLFVAYNFPPDAEVGALRIQKFVKYLPEFGWDPYVLTVYERFYSTLDISRLNDVRAASIDRTCVWRTPLQLFLSFRDKYIRNSTLKTHSTTNSFNALNASINRNFITNFKYFISALNNFPDDKMYWVFSGLRKGIQILKQNDIKFIIATSPPHSSLILGYLLSLFSNVKLIIDFRDPWHLEGHSSFFSSYKPKFLKALEQKIQTTIVKRSSAVLTTNDFFQKAFINSVPFFPPNNIFVIHNGYDSSDFQNVIKNKYCEIPKKFIISYLGTFYMKRTPSTFFSALSELISNRKLTENDVEVRLIGNVHYVNEVKTEKIICDFALKKFVKVIGYVDYTTSLNYMKDSNLLLLMAPEQPFQIPAKTYEYMASGVPILALSEQGATSFLINDTQSGISFWISSIPRILCSFWQTAFPGNGSGQADSSHGRADDPQAA
jgi:glycosyltransferase involved in cell wall biosynthesis